MTRRDNQAVLKAAWVRMLDVRRMTVLANIIIALKGYLGRRLAEEARQAETDVLALVP